MKITEANNNLDRVMAGVVLRSAKPFWYHEKVVLGHVLGAEGPEALGSNVVLKHHQLMVIQCDQSPADLI